MPLNRAYVAYCEQLWQQWRAENLVVPDGFQVALPEPYLTFQNREDHPNPPLIVLTYNPGAVIANGDGQGFQTDRHELWAAIRHRVNARRPRGGHAGGLQEVEYAELSRALAEHYQDPAVLNGRALQNARNRINAMMDLSAALNCNGVIQVECCPFHSATFSKRHKHTWMNSQEDEARAYIQHLAHCIQEADCPVVAVSGCGPINEGMELSEWLEWQAGLLGLNGGRQFLSLIRKKEQPSVAAFWQDQGGPRRRVLSLMRGNNSLPNENARAELAERIGRLPLRDAL